MELERLEREAWTRHQVFIKVAVGAEALLRWSLALTPMPLTDALTQLAVRVSERLRQKESVSGTSEWNTFLHTLGPSAGAVIPLLNPQNAEPS